MSTAVTNADVDFETAVPERAKINVDVLDVAGLASLLRIPASTILTLRSRAPDRLPAPFRTRPLRWRAGTAVEWMAREEQVETARIASLRRARGGR